MRSRSTISNTSHLDISKNKASGNANKESKASLFGAAPTNPSGSGGLFGKPPVSDIMRESPAFGNNQKQSSEQTITNKPVDKE